MSQENKKTAQDKQSARAEKLAQLTPEQRAARLKRRKKLKYGTIATSVTVIVVAIVVLLNVVANLISKRYPDAVLDLTTEGVYDVSEETIDYVKNLQQDVTVAVSADEANFTSEKYNRMISEMLNKYAGYSDHIDVVYFDITKDADVRTQLNEGYSGSIGENQLIVKSGSRVKVFPLYTLFAYDEQMSSYYGGQVIYDNRTQAGEYITGFSGEQTLTQAIMNVTDSNPKSVGFIGTLAGQPIYAQTTANMYGAAACQQLLSSNGYDLEQIDLSDDFSQKDYSILVLPAPANDLTPDAVSRLSDYLYNDGALGRILIYIADITQAAQTPNLDGFLKEWNVAIDSAYVNESDNSRIQTVQLSAGSYAVPAATVNEDTEERGYDGNLDNPSLPIAAPFGRPIDEVTANNGRTVTPLLTTSATSFRIPLSAAQEGGEFDVSQAAKQSNTVMALCRDQQSTGSEFIESDVIVMGSMTLLDIALVQDSSYNNAEYFIGVLNAVCGKEDSIVIAQKDLARTSITASETQLIALRTIVIFLIPLAVVAAGICVAVVRRRK